MFWNKKQTAFWKSIHYEKWLRKKNGKEAKQVLCLSIDNCQLPLKFDKFINLIKLTITNIGLTELPSNIGLLTHLQILCCDDNKLTTLPTDIQKLTALTALSLQNNNFEEIPLEIVSLKKLFELDMSHNKLKLIPPEIANLQLRRFKVQNNMLSTLPAELATCTHITINFANNPIEFLPSAIIKNLQQNGSIINADHRTMADKDISMIKQIMSSQLDIRDIRHSICANKYISHRAFQIIMNYGKSSEVHDTFKISFRELFLHVYSYILAWPDNTKYFQALSTAMEIDNVRNNGIYGQFERLIGCLDPDWHETQISENDTVYYSPCTYYLMLFCMMFTTFCENMWFIISLL